jgi:hypothetical protein
MRIRVLPPRLAARQLAQPMHIAPKLLERRLRSVPDPDVAVIAIYRRDNAATIARLLAGLPDAEVALWALDEVAPALADRTLGTGGGTRPGLLNQLQRAVGGARYLVVTDDDVSMPPRQLRLLVRACCAAGLDLAQPAHAPLSHVSWPFVRQRLTTYVRLTGFVEQGPLIVLSPHGVGELFPMPEDIGMGWGLEARWARRERDGLRLGIVDAAGMRHLVPAASAYDRGESEAAGRDVLRENGFSSYGELQVVRDEWRVGQPAPDWIDGKPG